MQKQWPQLEESLLVRYIWPDYAIECSLKAYLQQNRIGFPQKGQAGHDLQGLWKSTGFRFADLNDTNGAKWFYIRSWSSDLRYSTAINKGGLSNQELIEGARSFTGWIHNQISRKSLRRRL